MDESSSATTTRSSDSAHSPKLHFHPPPRPKMASFPSNSAPSTPQQLPRDHVLDRGSPSPSRRQRTASTRSVSSESSHTTLLQRAGATSGTCRFQSTQTSRRRIPYSIGSDPLPLGDPPKFPSEKRQHELNRQADALYAELLPTPANEARRSRLLDKIQSILREEIPHGSVEAFVFGSSGNLLCTQDSDVDICVVVKGKTIVCDIAQILSKRKLERITCVHAKSVPIVKVWDSELQMSCDLNVNNHVALTNTRLVRAYMSIGKPVVSRALAMLVKHWTQRRVLNEASGGALSSYTWTLLVINYLQTVGILPVIPLTDDTGRPKQDFAADIEHFNSTYEWPSSQPQELGLLLFGFFQYYAYTVDFEQVVFSVRQGMQCPKASSRWVNHTNNNRFCIEEPFTTERNLGNTADDTAARGIHEELRAACTSLLQDTLDLDGDTCKQFEFPKEVRTDPGIFQKAISNLPTMSRSRSQAGRGGKHGSGNTRGNLQRHNDSRASSANRRASSGTMSGSFMGLPFPDMLPHGQLPPSLIPPGDVSAYMNLEGQKVDLRMRQMQLQRGFQLPDYGSMQASMQARGTFPGFHLPPQTLHAAHRSRDGGPQTAAMYPTYYSYGNLGAGVAGSSVAMSPSSSQQGVNAPGSPMLQGVSVVRQHMSMPSSPGPASRSLSQPARSGERLPRRPQPQPQLQPQSAAGDYFQQPTPAPQGEMQYMPPPGGFRSGFQTPRYSMSHLGYVDANGQAQSLPHFSGPRQYVGYGISPSYSSPNLPGLELSSIPAFEDLHRQGRPRSPRSGESGFVPGSSRSPSPREAGANHLNGSIHGTILTASTRDSSRAPTPMSEAPEDLAPSRTISRTSTWDQPRPAADSGPLIVNGSGLNHARSFERTSGSPNAPSLEAEDQSEVHQSSATEAWKQFQAFAANGHGVGNGSRPFRYTNASSYRHSDSGILSGMPSPYLTPASNEHNVPSPPSHRGSDNAWNSSKTLNTNSAAKLNGLNGSSGHLLSPVTENRTPSPELIRESKRGSVSKEKLVEPYSKAVSNGIGDASRPTQALSNIIHGKKKSGSNGRLPTEDPRYPGLPVPPTPLRSSGESLSAGAVPSSAPFSAASSSRNSMPPPPVPPTQWQQAGSKKKKMRGGSTGGQPLPANVSERKGG